jgi:hypothetical protein
MPLNSLYVRARFSPPAGLAALAWGSLYPDARRRTRPPGFRAPLQASEQEDFPLNKRDAVPATAAAKGKKGKPDEVDPEFEGLMSEIEGDLRSDEFKKLWKNYGTLIVTLVVLLIVGVTGFTLYRQYAAEQHLEAARRYELAVQAQQAGRTDDAMTQFGALVQDGGRGYSALARLNQAALQMEKQDYAAAIANYQALAADEKADPLLRDLAVLLRVLNSLDREDPKVLEAALTPLTNPNNAFNLSALELSALLAAKQGDTARAIKTLAQISTDPSTSTSMRQRADDLAKLYQSGATPPPPTAPAAAPAKP